MDGPVNAGPGLAQTHRIIRQPLIPRIRETSAEWTNTAKAGPLASHGTEATRSLPNIRRTSWGSAVSSRMGPTGRRTTGTTRATKAISNFSRLLAEGALVLNGCRERQNTRFRATAAPELR